MGLYGAKLGEASFGQSIKQSLWNGSGVDTQGAACQELTIPYLQFSGQRRTPKMDRLSLNPDSYSYQLCDLEQVVSSLAFVTASVKRDNFKMLLVMLNIK